MIRKIDVNKIIFNVENKHLKYTKLLIRKKYNIIENNLKYKLTYIGHRV